MTSEKYLLHAASISNLPIILTGDVNIDTLKHDNFSKEYLELLQTFQCYQHIREATRISSMKITLSQTQKLSQ